MSYVRLGAGWRVPQRYAPPGRSEGPQMPLRIKITLALVWGGSVGRDPKPHSAEYAVRGAEKPPNLISTNNGCFLRPLAASATGRASNLGRSLKYAAELPASATAEYTSRLMLFGKAGL